LLASPWTDPEGVAAIGTLVLAAFTAWLAWTTRRLARAAGSETRANWRPVLVFALATLEGGRLSLSVRNVGRGPALRLGAYIMLDSEKPKITRPRQLADVVAPGEPAVIEWSDFDPPTSAVAGVGLPVWDGFDGELSYFDVSYSFYRTTFKLGIRSDRKAANVYDWRHEDYPRGPRRVRLRSWWWLRTAKARRFVRGRRAGR